MSISTSQYGSKIVANSRAAFPWSSTPADERLQVIGMLEDSLAALMTRLENDQWTSVSRAGSYQQFLTDMLGQAQTASSGFLLVSQPAKSLIAKPTTVPRGSAEALLNLVENWLAEDDGYDAEAWPIIQKDIEENRLSDRSRFHD